MHWITRLADRLPAGDDATIESYLALLDSALLDRYLAITEEDALLESATYLGLARDKVMSIHRSYLQAVACVAWEDRVISDDEMADLHALAPLLGLAVRDVVDAIAVAKTTSLPTGNIDGFHLVAGDVVVLTGDMRRSRDEWTARLEAAGFIPGLNVTKKTKSSSPPTPTPSPAKHQPPDATACPSSTRNHSRASSPDDDEYLCIGLLSDAPSNSGGVAQIADSAWGW